MNTISGIKSIVSSIMKVAKQVKANKKQTKRLAERIEMIYNELERLNILKPEMEDKLKYFHDCLEKCLEFIEEFNKDGWFDRIVKYGNHRSQFKNLNEQLEDCSKHLQCHLTIELFDREEDTNDSEEDWNFIKTKVDEIKYEQQQSQHQTQENFQDVKQMIGSVHQNTTQILGKVSTLTNNQELISYALPVLDTINSILSNNKSENISMIKIDDTRNCQIDIVKILRDLANEFASLLVDTADVSESIVKQFSDLYPKQNVMVVHSEHHQNFKTIFVHEHIDIPQWYGKFRFHIYVFDEGEFTLMGPGGYKNWRFRGSFERNGNQVTFLKM